MKTLCALLPFAAWPQLQVMLSPLLRRRRNTITIMVMVKLQKVAGAAKKRRGRRRGRRVVPPPPPPPPLTLPLLAAEVRMAVTTRRWCGFPVAALVQMMW
jgi:hypothetical protein